jgi:hypothetical protein
VKEKWGTRLNPSLHPHAPKCSPSRSLDPALAITNFSDAFSSLSDKTMRWIALLTLAAFFTPRCSAIHAWDAVVLFHSNPASSIFGGLM